MNTKELNDKYYELYGYMSSSGNPDNMKAFGLVMNEMMDWMIANKPDAAQEWIEKLDSIKWNNYLTQKEAENIVAGMIPKAPWTRDQWKSSMAQQGYELERKPYYNPCALWVVMNMIMSDSSDTIAKYISCDDAFNIVYDLAIDKLTDEDKMFSIRKYFNQ